MSRTSPRAGRLAGLLLLLSLLLAACGGEPTVDEPAPDEPAPADAPVTEEPAGDATDDATDAPTADQTSAEEGPITVYSGRSEELVGPLMEQFTADTGIEVEVRYGDTAEMAATILEEGGNSPADVYYGQDAGALGALSNAGVLAELPEDITGTVEERFRADDGTWVGTSGRARVLVYSTELVDEADLPGSVLDLTDERWRGRVGWAPTNGSFQAFVTAMRVELGDDTTRQWLEDMIANDVQVYEGNSPIVEAAGRGEIEVGLVNHYYLYQYLAEDPDFAAANHFLDGGDVGSLVNVAGVGVLESSDQPEAAQELASYLLSDSAQQYFAEETSEYSLTGAGELAEGLVPLEDIQTPELDLGDIDDLQGTLELLRETGALQ